MFKLTPLQRLFALIMIFVVIILASYLGFWIRGDR